MNIQKVSKLDSGWRVNKLITYSYTCFDKSKWGKSLWQVYPSCITKLKHWPESRCTNQLLLIDKGVNMVLRVGEGSLADPDVLKRAATSGVAKSGWSIDVMKRAAKSGGRLRLMSVKMLTVSSESLTVSRHWPFPRVEHFCLNCFFVLLIAWLSLRTQSVYSHFLLQRLTSHALWLIT